MLKNLLSTRPFNHDITALMLRLIIGSFFIYYGYGKLMMWDSLKSMFPDYTGLGQPGTLALVIFAELGCGILVLIGFGTRFTIIPIAITMAVAYFVAHANDTFQDKQITLLYLLISCIVFMLGSGKYSADRYLLRK